MAFSTTLRRITSKIDQWSYLIIPTLMIAVILVAFLDEKKSSMVLTGDYPAFYSAGHILRSSPDLLYSLEHQRLVQNKYWPSMNGNFHVYAYPPFLALISSPLSMLSPLTSKLIYNIIQLTFLILSLSLVRKMYPQILSVSLYKLLTISLLFIPTLVGVISGQNSALSLFLLCSGILALKKSNADFAGVCFGLMAFKPQYGIIAAGLAFFCTQQKIKYLTGFILGLLTIILLPLSLLPSDIYLDNIKLIQQLAILNQTFEENKKLIVSLWGFFSGGLENNLLSLGLSIIFSSLLLYSFFKQVCENKFLASLLIPILIVLLSPQTAYYDLTLLIPTLFYLSLCDETLNFKKWILLILITATLLFIQPALTFSPLILISLLCFYLTIKSFKLKQVEER